MPSAEGATGVLPSQHLAAALADGWIGGEVDEASIQPASVDLRLGEVAYRIRCSFLPGTETVERRVKAYVVDELDLTRRGRGARDQAARTSSPCRRRLALPAHIRARTNPKSSTGRLDVFTRVITDGGHRFDEIAAGYTGTLWLEVVPLSFTVRVREGLALNQLRLIAGDRVALTDDELRARHAEQGLLFRDDRPVAPEDFRIASGLFLGLDLEGDEVGRVGYRAKPHTALLDMGRIGAYHPEDYWEPVTPRGGRPHRPRPGRLLPAAVRRGGGHPARPGRRDDGLRPDQRRAAHPLRRLLRPGLRLRPRPACCGAHGRPSRCGPTTCRS